MSRPLVWIVTGASRGLGAAIAQEALSAGHAVLATTRSGAVEWPHDGEDAQLAVRTLEVGNPDMASFDEVVATAVERFGTVDVLVNNAGFGDLTAFEETDDRQLSRTFETNLFGLMRMTRAVLPVMRQQRYGRILNVSSSAGNDGRGPALYHTSKGAVRAFTEALSFEVTQFGIMPTNVAPGFFRTDFLDGSSLRIEPANRLPDYDQHRAMIDRFAAGTNREQRGDPRLLARLLVEVAESEKPPLHLVVGSDAIDTLDKHDRDVRTDVDAWRDRSVDTAYPPEESSVDGSSFFTPS